MSKQLLRDGIWTSKRLRELPLEVHLAFSYLLPIADHHGRFELDERAIWAKVGAIRDDLPLGRVRDWLATLEVAGLFKRYEAHGQTYAAWLNYQGMPKTQRSASSLPEPPFDNSKSADELGVGEAYREPTSNVGGAYGDPTPDVGPPYPEPTSDVPIGVGVGEEQEEEQERNTEARASRGGWPGELSEAYTEITGGHLSAGRIGKALKPVLRRLERTPTALGEGETPHDLLKAAFGRWARSDHCKRGPEYLGRQFGDFVRERI